MSSRRAPLEELPRLPPGQHGLPREEVEASQRTRLQLAMVQAVAEHGYARTKIRELARIAGVSPNAFYELYEGKEACFLDTHDAIARIEIGRVAAIAAGAARWTERLHAAISAFVETVVTEPRAAKLAIVEVHAVGPRALEHQQQTLDAHERLMQEILASAPHGAHVPDTTVKAIVAGTRGLIQHHLAAGHPAALRTLVEPIHDWVLSYHTPHDPELPEPLAGRRRQPAQLPRASKQPKRAMSSAMSHRERIMRAVAALSCENGYGSLRMPLITAAAGVSNQTFYEHFANKHDAFMACYDRISRRALAAVLASFQAAPDWPRAIRASLQTLLSFIAAEPEFARLALFEVLAAGPEARMRAEARTETFTAMMTPGSPTTASSGSPQLLGALVSGGAWGVIQHHIIQGHTARLQELTPNLTYMVLTPFIGAPSAAAVAHGG